jgi:putative transposase
VRFIDEHKSVFGVEPICRVLSEHGAPIAPSTYYAAVSRSPSARAVRDAQLNAEITRVWKDNREVYGADKVWLELNRQGIPVARCTTERLMRQLGLAGVRRGRKVRTTVPGTGGQRAPDLLRRDFTAPVPNRRWVADFTYVATWSGIVYVAFVVDIYSRAIVGWSAATHKRARLVLDALQMALWRRDHDGPRPGPPLRCRVARRIQLVVATPRSRRCALGTSRKQVPQAPAGARRQWAADRALRPPMRSPGRPEPSRAVQREFWRLIASGMTTVEAAESVGVSWPVGARSLVSDCAKAAPPHAIMSFPGSRLRALILSARSPLAIVDCGHPALVSVLENTTLGISFIGFAYGSSESGQNPAISSYVWRPIRCRPASLSQSSFRAFRAGSSGGRPQPPAPNLPGRATRPSSEIPIINTSFLIVRPFIRDPTLSWCVIRRSACG